MNLFSQKETGGDYYEPQPAELLQLLFSSPPEFKPEPDPEPDLEPEPELEPDLDASKDDKFELVLLFPEFSLKSIDSSKSYAIISFYYFF